MTRRNFLENSTATFIGIEALNTDFKPDLPMKEGFNLQILATNWGFEGNNETFCAKAKAEGYEGIEMWWDFNEKTRNELFTSLKKHNLSIGFLVGGSEPNFATHFESFKKGIDAAVNSAIKPKYINCHSGRDYFTYEQNKSFIDYTTKASLSFGIPIYHETHRSRMLFAAHIGKQFMEKNVDLRLTFDVSHWCNVAESLLTDQPEAIKLAIERTGHIHARIGHQEGPQVNDPRAPEWEAALNAHLAWWDKIVARKMAAGEPLTILTEFGPPSYMPTLPYTLQPLANQWDINVYMMKLLRKRYLKG
jgi:sugar phosphate isomerase/epimerase